MSSRSIGRVEGAVGANEDLSRHGVGRHLGLANDRDVLLGGNVFADHLPQLLRRLDNALRLLAKQRREGLLGGHQATEQVERHWSNDTCWLAHPGVPVCDLSSDNSPGYRLPPSGAHRTFLLGRHPGPLAYHPTFLHDTRLFNLGKQCLVLRPRVSPVADVSTAHSTGETRLPIRGECDSHRLLSAYTKGGVIKIRIRYGSCAKQSITLLVARPVRGNLLLAAALSGRRGAPA